MMKTVKKLIAAPFVLVAAIIILFEDWLWDDLARLAALIGRLPVLRTLEALVASLPPYAALIAFAIPSLLLIPVKLAALYFISHGQATLAFLTLLAAKVVGTALVARIFKLTQPKLLHIVWFAWLYRSFMAFKGQVYDAIKATALYQAAHALHLRVRHAIRAWIRNRRSFLLKRWNAALKLSRRRKQLQF